MIGKRGYSFGRQYPVHYERAGNGWEIFDARTDEVLETADSEWRARDRAYVLNGSPPIDHRGIDETP